MTTEEKLIRLNFYGYIVKKIGDTWIINTIDDFSISSYNREHAINEAYKHLTESEQ